MSNTERTPPSPDATLSLPPSTLAAVAARPDGDELFTLDNPADITAWLAARDLTWVWVPGQESTTDRLRRLFGGSAPDA